MTETDEPPTSAMLTAEQFAREVEQTWHAVYTALGAEMPRIIRFVYRRLLDGVGVVEDWSADPREVIDDVLRSKAMPATHETVIMTAHETWRVQPRPGQTRKDFAADFADDPRRIRCVAVAHARFVADGFVADYRCADITYPDGRCRALGPMLRIDIINGRAE